METGPGEAVGTGLLRIGEAAREIGVSPSALRLWERQGLVTPLREAGGERRFGPAEMDQLRQVRRLRTVDGLNAAGIRRILGDGRGEPAAHATGGPGKARRADGRLIGSRLRALRTAAGLSLRDASARSGISPSFLSGLERGTTGASVAVLVRLATVYGTTASSLVSGAPAHAPGAAAAGAPPGDPGSGRLVREAERAAIDAGRGVRIEDLAARSTTLQPQLFVLAPGASSDGAYAHPGEEFMYVLQGRVAVVLDDREHHELGPGDALTFPSALPHRFVALGADETRILWVNTPPTF
jgi:DNA-binding transcriptional MerR regulator/quercetin dioxygenase-like cupin family protein